MLNMLVILDKLNYLLIKIPIKTETKYMTD